VILFLPSLMSTAEMGNDLLKSIARPVAPVLITILRFFLLKGCRRMALDEDKSLVPKDANPELSATAGNEGGLLQDILQWSFLGLLGAVAIIILGIAGYYLIRWLAWRRPAKKNKLSIWHVLLQWISMFIALFNSFAARITRKPFNRRGAGHLYTRLLRWGSHCGIRHVPVETPREYGSRLIQQFPTLRNEITLIVDLFNQTVYGLIEPEV